MKIAILNNSVPFLRGGAEHLADSLASKFREYGHQSEVFRIPFRWSPPEAILEHILACRLMQLPNVDLAIGLKFPAYYVPHSNKVLWLLHQFRQAYDFWGTPYQDLPNTLEGARIRQAIINADNAYLPEAKKIFTNSRVTGDRLRHFNGIASEVLFPPLLQDPVLSNLEAEDFILCPGRINGVKRQFLMVRAMKYCKTPVRLVVAGMPETHEDRRSIVDAIRADRTEDKVTFIDRFVSEEEKWDLLGRCLGCAYIPIDEDSYGYVTLEACLSGKPVITCSDSGGIEMLVRNQETGYLVDPDPKALANAMDQLFSNKMRAAEMGRRAREHAQSFNINWDHVIRTLTS